MNEEDTDNLLGLLNTISKPHGDKEHFERGDFPFERLSQFVRQLSKEDTLAERKRCAETIKERLVDAGYAIETIRGYVDADSKAEELLKMLSGQLLAIFQELQEDAESNEGE